MYTVWYVRAVIGRDLKLMETTASAKPGVDKLHLHTAVI